MEDRYLFKAKKTDSEEWVVGYYGVIGKRNVIIEKYAENYYCPDTCESRHGNQIHEVNSKTICQCTGLKDKNGKLIWENDIILFQRDNDDCPFPNKDTKKRLGKVFYKGFRTTFAIGMGKNGSSSINDDLWKYVQNGNRVEVIGNIFDNPELLESEG
jgi:uncharacterized phage protein (TIGR01671 family)|nr:MAG TPA: YopX protein [Bacteriophage sp.]